MNREFETEQAWLVEVLRHLRTYSRQISRQLKQTEDEISESLKMYNKDDPDALVEVIYKNQLLSSLKLRTKISQSSLKKPYFARVDFKEDSDGKALKYYLGKMSVFSDRDYPVVIDWRSPVASLYYDGRIGRAEYDCPDGLITGDISLKRQYFIEDAELQSFIDIDITANDEFLQAALGSSKDKRLKDIVSTIQAEQNRIIRADMHGPVIVQGAAGSGKTTIALHRIAYLLYTYEQRLSPEHVLVIAPNRYFLSYISEVLPDLGVENVRQTTFEDFVFAFIEKSATVSTSDEKLSFILNNPDKMQSITETSAYKSSLDYLYSAEKYIDGIILNLIPKKDFMLGEHVLMTYNEIQRLFCDEYAFLPVEKRVNEVRKYLSSALKKRKPEIISGINTRSDAAEAAIKAKTAEASARRREALTRLYTIRDEMTADINKKSQGLVSAYLKSVKIKHSLTYYNEFNKDAKLETEDLAPILLFHLAFFGPEGFDIRHIVIDEAQDMSPFRMYVLKKLLNTGSFTILGDLCQGIYSFMGINDWSEVSDGIFNGKDIRYMQLEQSYRTTVEIMEFANRVIAKLNLADIPLAKPVIRHGSEVCVRKAQSLADLAVEIDKTVTTYKKDDYKSIAIICKTAGECANLAKHMKTAPRVLTGKESDYGGGTVLLPAHLSKGLEFDCVIIANASEAVYTSSPLDIKLLYVAMTRALHELSIFSLGTPTDLISI